MKQTLLTMGCPLRQLYARRFPRLYAWAREDRGGVVRDAAPDPALLHVDRWVNAYRSGDYIGRLVWRDDTAPNAWTVNARYNDGDRTEFCIGAGAHTHYWDRTAPMIAKEIDALIES